MILNRVPFPEDGLEVGGSVVEVPPGSLDMQQCARQPRKVKN